MKRQNQCIFGEDSRQDCRFCGHYFICTSCIFPYCEECEFRENCIYLKQLPKHVCLEDLCINPDVASCNECSLYDYCPAIATIRKNKLVISGEKE